MTTDIPTTDDAADQPAADGAASTQTSAPDTPAWTPPASQAELDRIITDRLNRERAKFSDYDELKTAAARLAEIEEANKSEADKIAERAAAAEARAAELEARIRDQALRAAVTQAALAAGAVNPDQVLALLPTDAVTIDDDGNVQGAVEAVTAFLEASPHFVAQQAPRPGVTPVAGAAAPAKDAVHFTREQVARMTQADYERNRTAIFASMAAW